MNLHQATYRLGLLVALALAGCGGDPGIAAPLSEDEEAEANAALEEAQSGEASVDVSEE